MKITDIFPYLNKTRIKIINNFYIDKKYFKININFLDSLLKNNNYYTNILEQYSKILVNSNTFSKKQPKTL